MEPFGWFILACIVVGIIVYAYISAKITNYRQRRKRLKRLPDAPPPLIAGRRYNIQLSHGRILKDAYIVGMAADMEEQPWELQKWIVAQHPDGKMMYIRPHSIRFVEDA